METFWFSLTRVYSFPKGICVTVEVITPHNQLFICVHSVHVKYDVDKGHSLYSEFFPVDVIVSAWLMEAFVTMTMPSAALRVLGATEEVKKRNLNFLESQANCVGLQRSKEAELKFSRVTS